MINKQSVKRKFQDFQIMHDQRSKVRKSSLNDNNNNNNNNKFVQGNNKFDYNTELQLQQSNLQFPYKLYIAHVAHVHVMAYDMWNVDGCYYALQHCKKCNYNISRETISSIATQ